MRNLLLVSLLALSCKPSGPANYPDTGRVQSAQTKWCEMLASLEGEDWRHQSECESATPTGSAQFIERMVPCFRDTVKDYGEGGPDSGLIVDDCTQQVLGGVDPGDVSDTDLMKARCDRMVKCQKIEPESCRGINDRLDGMTKAMLTSMYNLAAQGKVAECLADTECAGDDEDRVHNDCYKDVRGHRVWLPLSLGH